MAFIKVPTVDVKYGHKSHREFATREEWLKFLWEMFKEPGEYEFDNDSDIYFISESTRFSKNGFYCMHPYGTTDFADYWEGQKDRCRNGLIVIGKGGKTWYLTRYYYMWLNFLPIYNKEISKFSPPKIRDAQYHLALYEDLARYSYKHAGVLKKRQIASSYYHASIIINNYWFEEGSVNKIGASLKDYISEKATWRFLEEYRNFLNEHTAWYRPSTPDKVFNWEQKVEITTGDGRKMDKGNKSLVTGHVLDKDPTNGVGGPCTFFFHEESGIAPKMNQTLEYLLPAMKSGMIYTGWYAAAGSVGDLDQCEPLKQLILNPASKDVLAVPTKWFNKEGEVRMCGLFIPEQYSMPPCIDSHGNSLVDEAIKMILAEREQWKIDLSPEDYQLRISQKPITVEEAFAYRKQGKFPAHLVAAQIQRVKDKLYPVEFVDLDYDENGKVKIMPSSKLPISTFPISPKDPNKEGIVCIYERPVKDIRFGMYYASIDPVSEGKTTTSDSLCSIFVMKAPTEVIIHKEDGTIEHQIEPEKMVASWCGRFDDINKTHKRLELIILLYQAWAICENNVSVFIMHMIQRKLQKYLVPKDQIMFLKELKSNMNVFQEYGWKNTGTLFKSNLLSYGVEFVSEEIDNETKPDGTIVKIHHGVERIPDGMLLEEMKAYYDGLNVDRLVAFCALVAFIKVQFSNRGYVKREQHENTSLQKPSNMSNLIRNPFRNIGKSRGQESTFSRPRSAFRNMR